MGTVNITFRADEATKKQADILFADLGMSLSTAINIFLKQAVREQAIPFSVSRNVPNNRTLAAMDIAEEDKNANRHFNN